MFCSDSLCRANSFSQWGLQVRKMLRYILKEMKKQGEVVMLPTKHCLLQTLKLQNQKQQVAHGEDQNWPLISELKLQRVCWLLTCFFLHPNTESLIGLRHFSGALEHSNKEIVENYWGKKVKKINKKNRKSHALQSEHGYSQNKIFHNCDVSV